MVKKKGLYANIHAKRKRIKKGSKEKMRKPGTKGAPTKKQFKRAAKTAKKEKEIMPYGKGTYGKKVGRPKKKKTKKRKK